MGLSCCGSKAPAEKDEIEQVNNLLLTEKDGKHNDGDNGKQGDSTTKVNGNGSTVELGDINLKSGPSTKPRSPTDEDDFHSVASEVLASRKGSNQKTDPPLPGRQSTPAQVDANQETPSKKDASTPPKNQTAGSMPRRLSQSLANGLNSISLIKKKHNSKDRSSMRDTPLNTAGGASDGMGSEPFNNDTPLNTSGSLANADLRFSLFNSVPPEKQFKVAGSRFQVRSTGYKKTGLKVPSEEVLYEFIGGDAVAATGSRITNLSEQWGLVDKIPSRKGNNDVSIGYNPAWGIPEVLVTNLEMPYQSGSLWGAHPAEDLGFNIISYHVLSEYAINLLNQHADTTSKGDLSKIPALYLLKQMLDKGKSEKAGFSFKKICQVRNIVEMDVPNFIKGYNGKPVLVTGSCNIKKFNKSNVETITPRLVEFSYDVRNWAYAMRSSLGVIFPKIPQGEVEFGWLVEGKTDQELPEQILCSAGALNLNVHQLMKVEGK